MTRQLEGRRVAVLAVDGVEQDELEEPRRAVEYAGGTTELLSVGPGDIQAYRADVITADRFPVDALVSRSSVDDYDGLILPGGMLNADRLRLDEHAMAFVRHFMRVGKAVAAIGHAPWLLIQAGAVEGRTLTGSPSLRVDVVNAGGHYVDEAVVVDRSLVTSRGSGDLHHFCAATVGKLTQHPQPAGA